MYAVVLHWNLSVEPGPPVDTALECPVRALSSNLHSVDFF